MNESMTVVARRAGSELNNALAQHEHDAHQDRQCKRERINALGYLAHRLGVDLEDDTVLASLILRATDYDATHRDHEEHASQL